MKKLSILLLSISTLPVYAQSIWSNAADYQNSLEPRHTTRPGEGGTAGSSTKPVPDVTPGGASSSNTSGQCTESDQTSIPLSALTSLILERDAKLDIVHNARTGSLEISASEMIGNCSSMLDWKLKQPTLQGSKAYAIEVKFKSDGICTTEGCKYSVAKVKDGQFEGFEDKYYKPTLKGFEQCLKDAGVFGANGKVDKNAIYPAPINEKFSGVTESAKLLFLSHGPSTPMMKAKYGKFDSIDKCDYYEQAHPNLALVTNYAEEQRNRLSQEAREVAECKEYNRMTSFMDQYQEYADQLVGVRDELILKAAEKSAIAIMSKDGKYTSEDIKVMDDFNRYIVGPQIEKVKALYQALENADEAQKGAYQDALKVEKAKLAKLKSKPYFTGNHTQKLINDGRFADAEKLNSIIVGISTYEKLGLKQNNVVVNLEVAEKNIKTINTKFKAQLELEQEKYEIRTGQVTGKSEYYDELSARMRRNIQTRSENYALEIQDEMARISQPNGHCFKYWVNTQKCVAESQEIIEELVAEMQHFNKIDAERAAEFDEESKGYSKLEAEGRRYIAAQNGEEYVEEKEEKRDNTKPSRREERDRNSNNNGAYTFNWPQQAQQVPQNYQMPTNPYMNQNMFQQQMNPYQYYQQPLGAQAYGQIGYQGNAGYNFNWGGNQQQMMYGQQYQQNPYMMYSQQYNMYR